MRITANEEQNNEGNDDEDGGQEESNINRGAGEDGDNVNADIPPPEMDSNGLPRARPRASKEQILRGKHAVVDHISFAHYAGFDVCSNWRGLMAMP